MCPKAKNRFRQRYRHAYLTCCTCTEILTGGKSGSCKRCCDGKWEREDYEVRVTEPGVSGVCVGAVRSV